MGKMKGRWDIVYVENAKKSINPVNLDFQLLYLESIKNSNPKVWGELKKIIKKVDDKGVDKLFPDIVKGE